MRTLTPNTKTKSNTPKGTQPIKILEIRWESGVIYYSEVDYTFNSQACKVALIHVSDVSSSGKIGSSGEVASINFELDDTDSSLKTKVNTEILEGTICVLWHHYYDLASSDATIVHYGKMAGPLSWSEETRIFSGSVESIQGKGEIGFSPSDDPNNDNYVADLLASAYNSPFPSIFGSPLRVPTVRIKEDPAEYVVSVFSTVTVFAAYAHRQCYGGKDDDLFIVPAGFYSIRNDTIDSHAVTILSFPTPLSSIKDEGWSDEIFVDCGGGLSSNPISQIEWILDTFTDLNIDSASFTAAKTATAVTPAHYALFTQEDAVPLCEKIAWQARCLLFLKNGTAYIRTLFTNTVTDAAITLNETKLKSVELSFTETEDIVTVFNAKWKKDYSGQKEAEQTTTIKNNLIRYGVISQDYDFFIYTTLKSIQIASLFWAYRYANSWRKIVAQTFLTSLKTEAYDLVQFSHPTLSTHAIRGFAESVKHNLEDNQITIEAELGSKAGDHSGGQPIEDPKYWLGGDGKTNGYNGPIAARLAKSECDSDLDKTISTMEDTEGGVNIHIESGSITPYNAYEIYWVEKNHHKTGTGDIDLYHVGTPRDDNIEPGQILFTKETTVGYYGYGFHAGEDVWCNYDLNPQNHPNYFDSPVTKIGDNVGTLKNSQVLSKSRQGFVVQGISGGKVAVESSSIDKKLEKLKSTDPIPLFSPAEIYGYEEDYTLVRIPSADNLPPGKIAFPVTSLAAGEKGRGYNAFDVSPFITGAAPTALGSEFGTRAGSTQLEEGGTGFVAIGRKGGRNQYRPF